jgi:Polysaccharide biosynthesis/export protein
MKTKVRILLAFCSLSFAFAIGAAAADAPLRPGDQIQMELGSVPSTEISALSGIYTVDGDGSVNLPHVGRVNIAGITPGAAESAIENVYKSHGIYTMIIDVNKIGGNPTLDGQVESGDRIEAPSVFQNSKYSEGFLQQAQQSADPASSQGNAVASSQQADAASSPIPEAAAPSSEQVSVEAQLKEAQDQGAALETQLKQVQDKLQQVQQNADLASGQRAALESQLKQAQEKLQQTEQNADLASNRCADLEAQLKEAQDKLRQAQQDADLASSERANLEARVAKTEENLRLAELAATQRDATAARKNADSIDQLKSGRTFPLDEGDKAHR